MTNKMTRLFFNCFLILCLVTTSFATQASISQWSVTKSGDYNVYAITVDHTTNRAYFSTMLGLMEAQLDPDLAYTIYEDYRREMAARRGTGSYDDVVYVHIDPSKGLVLGIAVLVVAVVAGGIALYGVLDAAETARQECFERRQRDDLDAAAQMARMDCSHTTTRTPYTASTDRVCTGTAQVVAHAGPVSDCIGGGTVDCGGQQVCHLVMREE